MNGSYREIGEHKIDPRFQECVICGSSYYDIQEGRGRKHIPNYTHDQYKTLEKFDHELSKLQRVIGQIINKFKAYEAYRPVWVGAGDWDLGWERGTLWVKSSAAGVVRVEDMNHGDLIQLCATPNVFEALDEKIRNSTARDIATAKEAFTNLYNFLEKTDGNVR